MHSSLAEGLLAENWVRPDYGSAPERWTVDRLHEHPWSAQKLIMRSVVENRFTAVPSAHDLGKSYTAARVGAWWLTTGAASGLERFLVSTAPSAAQVSAILWRELAKAHARGRLPGRITRAGYPMWHLGDELIGYGRKPADHDESAFQGIHSPGGVLVLIDEAGGVPPPLWDAVRSLVGNERSRVLAIGNPDDATSEFARVCRPGSGWNVTMLDALRSPNMTEQATRPYPLVRALMQAEGIPYATEDVPDVVRDGLVHPLWLEEMMSQWCGLRPDMVDELAPDELREILLARTAQSQLFEIKARGRFATNSDDSVIPLGWIQAAVNRWLDFGNSGQQAGEIPARYVLGVDVARGGSDESAIAVRRGELIERIRTFATDDTMQVVNEVLTLAAGTVAGLAMVDSIGIGAGVLDRLRQMRREGTSPIDAQPFTASAQSNRRDATGAYSYRNDRSAAWWGMRELLDPARGSTLMLPDDDRLVGELAAPKWTVHNGSVIVVESKDEIRKRLGHSTDRADAVISSYFTSGTVPGVGPSLPVPTDPVMSLLRHDSSAPWQAWNDDQPDVTGTIWDDRDP